MAEEGGNPLVATVDTGSWTGSANTESLTYQEGSKKGQFSTDALSKDTEGAGLFSDAASTIGDISSHNWGGVAVDAVGDGMDALGMAMDPLGSLAGAGIGWLIEHVGFLKKPLDYLAGDPESVTAKAQTWTNVSKALSDAADQYKGSAQTLASANTSDAVSGASATGENLAKVLDGAAQHASDAASAMKVAAVAVGTTRGIIRDTISQFAGDAIVKWIAATAAAFFTFGATEAAFIVDEVAEGASVATQDASKVSKLLQVLEKFKGGAKDSENTLKNAASDLDRGAKDTDSLVHDASDAGGVHTDAPPKADAGAGGGATAPSDAGGAPSVEEPPKADAGAGGEATTPSDAGGTPSTEAPPEADPGAGGGSTTPSDTSGGTPTTEEPPTVDAGNDVTTPSESGTGGGSGGGGSAGGESGGGESGGSGGGDSASGEGGSGSGEGGSGGDGEGTKPQHYWQKEEEGPSHEEVNQHVADHKQAVDSHNQEVAAHNQKADQFKRDAAEHNQKAVDNQQALAANKHARDMNQQAINRARAEGKPHDSLNAEHRRLEAEHKNLRSEDERLRREQEDLNQRKQELDANRDRLNQQASDLHEKQQKLTHEKGDDMRKQAGLENSRFDGNKVVEGLRTVHKIWEGPIEGFSMGDALKEPLAQGLSDQATRDSAVGYESDTKQQEWAEEQEKEAGESESKEPAWPTSEH